ncbi:NACHT domain-containing protein [Pseudomonas fluorescens]|uniref:NACHT domain-containing protein n=1 Tax=Pseudomonas fluorescens TaxID=294 RepID=UPI001906F681|nr:NACHT domain-containing protein [Pseudomonas fluorescens]MBD8092548.1 NACHT domain-containing protein [Pseudomonas fluorescens]MBD8718516.1 NACHT domain-containing protein [Pseudomonas fluorescens]
MSLCQSMAMPTPFAVLSPPDTIPSRAPVATRDQELPFDALSWENFERLCHRLTALEGDVEHCARYGRQGEAQEGIDIYARKTDGRYHCLQAKRHRSFGAAQLLCAVDLFLDGTWAARAISFTVAVQASLRSIVMQEEIERQAARLRARGITFETLDGEGLTARLRHQPELIDDFFGRSWVAALLGPDVASSLGSRLDGNAFARVRAQLANVYEVQFQFFDPGSFGSISDEDGKPALTLLERFLKPDILVRESSRTIDRSELTGVEGERSVSSTEVSPLSPESEITRSSGTVANSRMRRLPVGEWLGDGERLVLLGEAGCGKSTLLRVVALDLLKGQSYFPELATSWGQYLPVYIPFAHWSAQVARDGHAIGIKEIVRRSLQHFLTSSIVDLLDRAFDDKRVLLLIDGLDEWSGEQAARATLSALVTTVEAHNVPVIVSGRPRGLSRIGTLPANWKRGTVAPLSTIQQATIARRWFERYDATESNGAALSNAGLRTGRFMAELARDANLGALAAVPLLLIGLVTLALRGQILPRTRGDIYDQLVRVLLEVHPENRATASGDTTPRFRHATDPDQRRAAIARLAFAMREQSGGGMPLTAAREILRTYLTSPQGFDLPDGDASAAANEILSVNAETQGLIVEKAFSEVGFVHASFEEFLCAEHIGGWPFSEIEAFVRSYAGEGRWRNVITYLLGYIQRRDEFDLLIRIIEEPEPDDLVRFHRQFLLGDIAFGSAIRATANATVKRLALATMHRVETEDWAPARREALASVLKGLADPAFKVDIEQRLRRWLPGRRPYRASLIGAFGAWQPAEKLQDLLVQSMHDEDPGVQRAAAAAYASAFSPSTEACERLLNALTSTRDLAAAAAILESLALGWPNAPAVTPLFQEAWLSHGAELRLVGILGLAATGSASDEARDIVLRCQNHWSDVSYPHHDLAATMLMKYWPGDEILVKSALDRVSGNFDSIWEHTSAIAYLLESPLDRADVRAWILAELGREHPFNIMSNNRCWAQVGRFAAADPDIRSAANAHWCEPKNRLIKMHALPNYVAHVADRQVAAAMIEVLGNREEKFNRHWALSTLLTGWGRDHPEVKSAIDALIDAVDEDLDDLVALLPNIVLDKAAARARLIRMGRRSEVRRDLLTIGLEACGCDSSDDEAVAAILAFPVQSRGTSGVSYQLFRTFGENNNIREVARECLREADGPLEAIAACYKDDPEFASSLFDIAVPLPIDLRTQVVEVAATGAAGTALEAILGQGMLETDPELRVRMVIAHHRALLTDAHESARQTLLDKAVNVGIDHGSIRAAALAGLVTMGALEEMVNLEERGKPVGLYTGNLAEGIPAIERLICERFEEFEAAFGDSLSKRLETLGNDNRLAEILSTAPGASPAARVAFLALAERGEMPCTPHALRALAAERHRSDLLLARCWDTIDSREYRNDHAMVNADVGLILRDHFSGNPGVRQRLVDQFNETPVIATAIPLAIFAPDAEELTLAVDFNDIGKELGEWTLAVSVAAHRADSATFCKLLESMLCRRWRSQFDAQSHTNLAIEERLQWDSELQGLLSERINKDVDPSISGSFSRYLAAAGKLSPEARVRTMELLRIISTDQRLPIAGYDAIADQWRATRATLLDAVFAGLEFS